MVADMQEIEAGVKRQRKIAINLGCPFDTSTLIQYNLSAKNLAAGPMGTLKGEVSVQIYQHMALPIVAPVMNAVKIMTLCSQLVRLADVALDLVKEHRLVEAGR